MSIEMETLRKIGYDILINHFEPFLRKFLIKDVLLKNFKADWRDHISVKAVKRVKNQREIDITKLAIEPFFEELLLSDLKRIINKNFLLCKDLLGDLVDNLFNELMNELNRIRIRVAHPKENFSNIDIENIKRDIRSICRGKAGKEMLDFLNNYDNQNLNSIKIIDPGEICINNLPAADYDLDGGFVGRKSEIKEIKKKIYSNLDRILTIMGAGGVGKTSLALEIAKNIITDLKNPFKAIIWFSAKEKKLTDVDIIEIPSEIKNLEQLIGDILFLIDKVAYDNYQQGDVPVEYYIRYLYKNFKENEKKFLLIIDNLESILGKEPIIKFIEDIPCKVLITSRIGLGKLERPIILKELKEDDSVTLFKHVAKSKDIEELYKLKEDKITELVNRMKRYPLALKWSIGQFLIGKDLDKAFPKKLPGESLIAQFSFNNVYSLLSETEILILFAITIWSEPVSEGMLKFLTDLPEEELSLGLRRLKLTSLIFQSDLNTKFSILSLTSDFIRLKLNNSDIIRINLEDKSHKLSDLIEEGEKISNLYETDEKVKERHRELISAIGIKTPEEKIAFNYVKTAKDFADIEKNYEKALEYYDKAIIIAPKLPYTYGEYSKFLYFSIKNKEKALKLAHKAVILEPLNFHHWSNYGKMLRLSKQGKQAIVILKKALNLNPNNLATMNQLGAAYSINKEFEEAENKLIAVQDRSKDVNLQIYKSSIIFRIDNLLSWAENLISKKKYDIVVLKLVKAENLIKEAYKLNPNNRYIYYYCRELKYIYGKLYETEKNYDKALDFFNLAIGNIFDKINEGKIKSVVPRSYYRIAQVNIQQKRSKEAILKIIEKGILNCKGNEELKRKFEKLKNSIK